MEQVEIPGSGVIGSCGSVFPATGTAISVSMYRDTELLPPAEHLRSNTET